MTIEERAMAAIKAMDQRRLESVVIAMESMARDYPRKVVPKLTVVRISVLGNQPRQAANKT